MSEYLESTPERCRKCPVILRQLNALEKSKKEEQKSIQQGFNHLDFIQRYPKASPADGSLAASEFHAEFSELFAENLDEVLVYVSPDCPGTKHGRKFESRIANALVWILPGVRYCRNPGFTNAPEGIQFDMRVDGTWLPDKPVDI